ncbi:twin-arginine translocase subunit TatC [Veillonella criceti]|uniref:Sec-independent protein translocase protein TatC n=1 Tax=Veillonella criceti TaxID=103891 RepID=A0A380NQ30_9FIRM|nr:twin-arginine translocase subunit TatC [Veillonella criceti]SUP44953.1 Sec-independent protein translocase protein TatCd [Veillonella criceti]
MESFQVRDFNDPKRKPSLNSVLAQKERLKAAERVRLGETVETSPENKAIADVDLEAIEPQYTPLEEQIMAENKAMSLVGHLGELRKRIIISAIAILVGFCVAYYYVDDILAIIIAPAGKLYYMRPTEAFFTYMKVALVAGLIAASPIWLYEVWAFVIPALTKQEKQLTNWFLPFAIILFIMGILFSYALVLPVAIQFFIGFATDELQPLFSIGQYIDFVIAFVLPFGLIFELPIVMIIMAKLNLITSAFLRSKRKIFLFLSFVIGGLISPTPDMFSQTMIAMPMIILYEVSLWMVAKVMKK